MSKTLDYLKTADEDCTKILTDAETKVNDAIEADVEQLQRNSLDNIPQQFGDFLYTALGDRVTGARSSVINTTFFESDPKGIVIAERAKAAGITIDEQCKQDEIKTSKQSYYGMNWNRPQVFISTGRKFGVSYFTGSKGRTHTIYFGAGMCFKYLTQDHVKCVKNKEKRQCVQDFLDFRNAYVDGMAEILNSVIETPVPIRVGIVSTVSTNNKYNRGGYRSQNSQKNFSIMEDVIDDAITHTLVEAPKIEVWDKISKVRSGTAKRAQNNATSGYVSLTFLKIDDKTVVPMGNIDIGMGQVCHSLKGATRPHNTNVIVRLDNVNNYFRLTSNPALKSYSGYDTGLPKGMILNMDEVIQNPAVHDILDKRIKFQNEMSVKLQELKHTHATLYFINADM